MGQGRRERGKLFSGLGVAVNRWALGVGGVGHKVPTRFSLLHRTQP